MKTLLLIIIIILLLIIYYLLYKKIYCIKKVDKKVDIDIDIEIDIDIDKSSVDIINKESNIIDLYKLVINREPSKIELENAKKISLLTLKDNLVNTDEYINLYNESYEKNINNNVVSDIYNIYKEELKTDKIPVNMVIPLRDCYIFLKYNKDLYRALLNNDKFEDFQNEILNLNYNLTNKMLINIFKKYFDINELKIKANDIIKFRKINNLDKDNEVEEINSSDIENFKRPEDDKDDLTFVENINLITHESH